jgi:hypothetical protein
VLFTAKDIHVVKKGNIMEIRSNLSSIAQQIISNKTSWALKRYSKKDEVIDCIVVIIAKDGILRCEFIRKC